MESTITYKDMIATMETGDPFSVTFVSLDIKRKRGGEYKEVREAILLLPPDRKEVEKRKQRTLTSIEKTELEILQLKTRQPGHRRNRTRNMRVMQNGEPTAMIVKFHPALVVKFNNKTMLP